MRLILSGDIMGQAIFSRETYNINGLISKRSKRDIRLTRIQKYLRKLNKQPISIDHFIRGDRDMTLIKW